MAADDAPTATREPAAATGRERTRPAEWIIGKLLDHGRDSYRFDPHEEMSYFVRIETPEGKRTIWGKDLQRAVAECGLVLGEVGEADLRTLRDLLARVAIPLH